MNQGPTEPAPGEVAGWAFRSPSNAAAGIYGSVLAASVAVGASGHDGTALTAILLVTGFVFWVAHVYAQTAASVHGWNSGAIRTTLMHEWPLMAASVPPAIAAALVRLLPADGLASGAWAACVVAILEQQLFGAFALRGADLTRAERVRRSLVNLAIGLLIILLKVALPAH